MALSLGDGKRFFKLSTEYSNYSCAQRYKEAL